MHPSAEPLLAQMLYVDLQVLVVGSNMI